MILDSLRLWFGRRRLMWLAPGHIFVARAQRILVLTGHRKCSRHQNRVGNGRFEGAVCLALASDVEPFRILQESSKLLFTLSQRFPLQNQEQIVVRLSDCDSPEPKLLDSMLLEQSHRIILKTFQQSWQAAGNAMEDS